MKNNYYVVIDNSECDGTDIYKLSCTEEEMQLRVRAAALEMLKEDTCGFELFSCGWGDRGDYYAELQFGSFHINITATKELVVREFPEIDRDCVLLSEGFEDNVVYFLEDSPYLNFVVESFEFDVQESLAPWEIIEEILLIKEISGEGFDVGKLLSLYKTDKRFSYITKDEWISIEKGVGLES